VDDSSTDAPESPDRPDLTARLPRFRLVRRLSRTNMSEVFHALDLQHGRPVALKVVGREFLAAPGARARFERETRIALGLDHPNIVPAYDAGHSADGELSYLAMRFVEGTDLGKVLDHRRLRFERTMEIGRAVAAALDTAHAQGLVHRDVKPGNILLETETGRIYLCDFGIARALDPALTRVTATGGFIGTRYYAAPEQEDGREVGPAADAYALACVLYHCLAGHPPGAHSDFAHPGLPALRRALDQDPAARPATCRELVDDLVRTTHEAERAARRKRRLRLAGLPAAALVVVALLVTWFATRGPAGADRPALADVPAALRADCGTADHPIAGATSSVTCRDPSGQSATTSTFADSKQADSAYAAALAESGVAPRQGDCTTATGGEHRYPATGPALGRALCYTRDGTSTVVWTEDAAHSVSRAEAPDDAALRKAWTGWTGNPAFPTRDESALIDVAAGTGCVRAAAADLDAYPGAVAGITCTPAGTGARSVSYYRFAAFPALRTAFTGLVTAAKAPSGSPCPGTPFLGTTRFDWLSVDLGQVLCHPGPEGTVAMDWSLEAFSMIGHVTATSPDAAGGWWTQWHIAPLSRIVDAVNTSASPAFPTPAERTLLGHVPAQSRLNCVRPSPDQKWQDLGAITPVAAVACGRTSGAGLVVYYQLPDAATMGQVFNSTGDSQYPCTSLPKDFAGDRPYTRNGRTGRLACGSYENGGERYLKWTDDQTRIEAVAHRGSEPFVLIDWWTHDAGPG
jgi:hypothetical protein